MDRDPHDVLGLSRTATWQEIRTAFRGLARRYHPDGTSPDAHRMAAVNAAFEVLERRQQAAAGATGATAATAATAASAGGAPGVAVGPGSVAPSRPPVGSLLWRVRAARRQDSPILDFGQYAGWSIADVAEHDPRYLVWLSRHSSGIRYQRAIEEALGSGRELGRRAAVLS